jgi:GcrA cell cycle regulator
MQSSGWAPEHCAALRDYLARGMSYSKIAEALNARFGTAYTRNATIGRGKRMGLVVPHRQKVRLKQMRKAKAPRRTKVRERRAAESSRPESAPTPSEPAKLRCVGMAPRLLSLVELEPGDCRYPYGGDKDGEAIAFCGHPRRAGSSYCTPHFHLTRGIGTASERAVGPVMLRLVQAA